MPFSLAMFPHAEGVCDAFDDPEVREIDLQWATRLGKTTTFLCLLIFAGVNASRNMMIAGPDEDTVRKMSDFQLYPLLRGCDQTRDQLPPEGRQSELHIKLGRCQIFVGWSGSPSSLAVVGARVAHNTEVDKWTVTKSAEADPLKLQINRVRGFVDHKLLIEGTPTIDGESRIQSRMAQANVHHRWVPCPHCGTPQMLVKGHRGTPGGFKWETDEHGHATPRQAAATAYYECEHCRGRIDNHHRVPMLRAGRWIPDGQRLLKSGKVVGEPKTPTRERIGFHLPSWYSLTEKWGDFPSRWVAAQGKPRDLQDVVNSDMAEVWRRVKRTEETWEKVAGRLIGRTKQGEVPAECSLLTIGVDKQVDHFVFVVVAWAPERVSTVIDYGTHETLGEIWEHVFAVEYSYEDGLGGLTFRAGLVDSSFAPTEKGRNVYEFARAHNRPKALLYAAKGSSTAMDAPWRKSKLGPETAMPGARIIIIDTWLSQDWIERQLHKLTPGTPGSMRIFAGSQASHEHFVRQLLNEASAKSAAGRMAWNVIDDGLPNDYRDCKRMADTAMLLATAGGPIRPRIIPAATAAQSTPSPRRRVAAHPLDRPGGWAQEFR